MVTTSIEAGDFAIISSHSSITHDVCIGKHASSIQMNWSFRADPKKLLIIGAGGLGSEYAWVAAEMNHAAHNDSSGGAVWKILGYIDADPQKRGQSIGGHFVHGTIEEACPKFADMDIGFAVAIGNNKARERMACEVEKFGWTAEILAHPSAIIAAGVEIGAGSYLAPGAVICPGARVGRHVIINTHVSVGHDSILEDFVQVCPGGRVSGSCRVETGGFIGSNASLAPNAVVGEQAVVGANSFVLTKVKPGTTVLGCPALAVGKVSR